MAQPTLRQVHVDAAMTQVAIAYSNNAYIARQVFPIVQVEKESDVYYIFTKEHWFRDQAKPVAPGRGPQEVGYSTSTSPYVCIPYGSRVVVPDQIIANADDVIQPRMRATRLAADQIELALEIRVADLVTTAANWDSSTTLSGTNQWNNDTSDPFKDITTAKQTVRDAIGREPNTIVMGALVWDQLWKHPDLVERMKYTLVGGAATPQQLGALFMVERVLIGAAIKNTAAEGATPSYSSIWGKNFWLGYVARTPALDEPSAGYIFRHGNRIAQRIRDDLNYRDVYDVIESSDEVITAKDAGYLIAGAVA